MYAAQLAAVPSYRRDLGEPWEIAKIYWTALSLSRLRQEAAMMAERGIENPFENFDLDNPPRFIVDDDAIACEVDGSEFADAKVDAMRAHATQIEGDGPFFARSNHVGNKIWGQDRESVVKGKSVDLGGRRIIQK